MHQAFEAAIDERGQVRLTEDIDLPVLRRAIVIVLDEPAATAGGTASESGKYTKKQGQYLAFIHHYTRVHNCPPAETDLQAFFGVTPPTVHQMIVRLEEKGLIKRVPRQARTIEVLVPPEQLPPLEWQRADDDEVRNGELLLRKPMILDPYGRILSETWKAGDDMVVADLDASLLEVRTGRRWIKTRRRELYEPLTVRTERMQDTRSVRCNKKGV